VDGATSIARRFHVSNLVIGLTVIAFGTSTPELFGNLMASLKGKPDIAVGNVLGSNISNMLLILGVLFCYLGTLGYVNAIREMETKEAEEFLNEECRIMEGEEYCLIAKWNQTHREDGIPSIAQYLME